MNAPAMLLLLRWLVRETFRQAMATGVFWLMLAVTAVCVLLCLSVTVEGDVPLDAGPMTSNRYEALPPSDLRAAAVAFARLVPNGAARSQGAWVVPPIVLPLPETRQLWQVEVALRQGVPVYRGQLSLAFGAVPVQLARDRSDAVRSLQLLLAGWVADASGLLLALLWTAGFLPGFLQPASASVLLAKPVPRWLVLAGKCFGVLVFVGLQAVLFVLLTWAALGLRTGVWAPKYLLCVGVLLAHFFVFFAFSALLAVTTRSAVVCVFGSVLFWLGCWGVNFARHLAHTGPEVYEMTISNLLLDLAYWALPKPLDFHLLLLDTLEARDFVASAVNLTLLWERGAWLPAASLIASLAAGLALFLVAGWRFGRADY